MNKKLNDIIQKALDNIESDREVTRDLLNDAISYLSKDESRHREIGIILSKYVETLQRSNEQLVKVVSLMSKDKSSRGLTEDDKKILIEKMDEIIREIRVI